MDIKSRRGPLKDPCVAVLEVVSDARLSGPISASIRAIPKVDIAYIGVMAEFEAMIIEGYLRTEGCRDDGQFVSSKDDMLDTAIQKVFEARPDVVRFEKWCTLTAIYAVVSRGREKRPTLGPAGGPQMEQCDWLEAAVFLAAQ
ncbi:hypothetical protein ANO11243_012800 [Dothideomycetidae sp. 11243]|nr:hypothetical protein ANO11243_012800 [fungal sp. No.11243]